MKVMHIESRNEKIIILPKEVIEKLPNKIMLLTTIQFIDSIEPIKKQLSTNKVITPLLKHCVHKGQLLGCAIEKIDGDFDAFLYIGQGQFHPRALALKNDKPVYIFRPSADTLETVDLDEVEKIRKKIKGAYVKFLSSDKIGVLISTKSGQYHPNSIKKLREKYPDKNFYSFVSESINLPGLEDFPFIDVFINTACPRIAYDDESPRPILDLSELYEQDNR